MTAVASSADQPDKDDPGAGRSEPCQPQCLRGNRKGAYRGPLHTIRKQGIEGALDHQDESERRPQIPHCPAGGAPRPIDAP